jgi:hypothetical protein
VNNLRIRQIVALLLILEGGYYLWSVIAVLIYTGIFSVDFRVLLIPLGVGLFRYRSFPSLTISIIYVALSLLNCIGITYYLFASIQEHISIIYVSGVPIFEMPLFGLPFFGIPIYDLPVVKAQKEWAVLVVAIFILLRLWQLFALSLGLKKLSISPIQSVKPPI